MALFQKNKKSVHFMMVPSPDHCRCFKKYKESPFYGGSKNQWHLFIKYMKTVRVNWRENNWGE